MGMHQKNLATLAKNPIFFTNVLLLIFSVLGLVGILNHAMWRDELNGWLIARDSLSFHDFFRNVKYEGHPALWYLCLYGLNQVSHNPILMQLFHWGLAVGLVYIFIRFSPFSRLQKTLFIFGYLPFYEYLLISRNYAIGILLIFAFCAFFPTRRKSYLPLASILFLLSNTNAFSLLISVALGATLGFELLLKQLGFFPRYAAPQDSPSHLNDSPEGFGITPLSSVWDFTASCAIFMLGVVASLALLIPPVDSTLAGGLVAWNLSFDLHHLATVLIRVWNAYIAILSPNTQGSIEILVFPILSLGLLVFSAFLLIRKPVALFLFLFGNLIILSFMYVKFLGGPRHYGHLYILLIAALWISSFYPEPATIPPSSEQRSSRTYAGLLAGWIDFVERHRTTFITSILVLQLAAGIFTFCRDMVIPWSASRETAKFIQSHHLDRQFIVGSRDAMISPISGYLNQKIYYPEVSALGSFVLFTTQRVEVNNLQILEQLGQLIQQHDPILLILNHPLEGSKAELSIKEIARLTNSFNYLEQYYLYQIVSHEKA